MEEAAQQVEKVAAAAAARLPAAHVHLCHAVVTRLCPPLFPGRAVELYCTAHRLAPEVAEFIAEHVIRRMGPGPGLRQRAAEEQLLRAGILRFRDWLRLQRRQGDEPPPELQRELAASRSIITRLHVRHAVRCAAAAPTRVDPAAAVAAYLDRIDLEPAVRAAVRAAALAQDARRLPRALALPAHGARLPRRGSRGDRQAVPA